MQVTLPARLVEIATLGEASFPSPAHRSSLAEAGVGQFVADSERVWQRGEMVLGGLPVEDLLFEKAGPRARLFFDSGRTTAAVVTCGGLCPGLNAVIRCLFLELYHHYGVRRVLGIRYGFQGLNPVDGQPPIELTSDLVDNIHREGGTFLGSSRGRQDVGTMVDSLQRHAIDLLFCVGGDGTHRGAHAIHAEVSRRGMALAVVGIPKTIDNDIPYCDRTFGAVTAVEQAREVLHLAHTEAKGTPRGIGLVKVMGRNAGFVACGATLASQEVNFTLIPELPFALAGERGFLAALERRMDARGHAVIVVAEGAGQDLCGEALQARDLSGNPRYQDVGVFLKGAIAGHFNQIGRPVEIKYIDPSYIIRSVAANCDDSLLCDKLARNAVHAAMAGKTDVMVSIINGKFVHVPIEMAVDGTRRVALDGELWSSVLAATGQPARLGR
ncbi:MAG TPA: ATP-dependent 6-phosphofructokinase [Pirellulales bacterium]|nr:ATP-dependent 6-phosphofructokinase [Pirellulales bacterium]